MITGTGRYLEYTAVGDRTSLWDNGVDVSNWNYDFTGEVTNDVHRPASTALNWNGLTVDQWFLLSVDGWDELLVDHVPTNVAVSLRRDEPYAMHVVPP